MANFQVRPTKETYQRLGLKEDEQVTLRTGHTHLTLINSKGVDICEWSFLYLRKYGYSDEGFSIEVGRRSLAGDGAFIFLTKQGKEIYKKMQQMKVHVVAEPILQNSSLRPRFRSKASNKKKNQEDSRNTKEILSAKAADPPAPSGLTCTNSSTSGNLCNNTSSSTSSSSLLPKCGSDAVQAATVNNKPPHKYSEAWRHFGY